MESFESTIAYWMFYVIGGGALGMIGAALIGDFLLRLTGSRKRAQKGSTVYSKNRQSYYSTRNRLRRWNRKGGNRS